jgi:hypothetical protein
MTNGATIARIDAGTIPERSRTIQNLSADCTGSIPNREKGNHGGRTFDSKGWKTVLDGSRAYGNGFHQ